jgi:hypothetical protein
MKKLTNFEQIPVAQVKKIIEGSGASEPLYEEVTRVDPADKDEPYSIQVLGKIDRSE